MGSEWVSTTLGEVLTLQRGFDLPINDRIEGPYLVVASTGIVGHHSSAMVKGPGIVIGRSGSLGGGQYINEDFWPLNTTLWVKDFKGNDPLFCYYLLKSIDFTKYNVGSGVPTLNRNHIHPLPVTVPDIPEQRAIAHILGSLDDKIELNRQMNQSLEAMAQAIFKSWFVDFDPVHAKAEGRDTGLPAEIAELFPDSFEESELGLVPKGWKVKPLDTIAEFLNGLACQKYPAVSDQPLLPVIKIRELRQGITYVTDKATTAVPPQYIINNGDVLFSWSGSLMVKLWCCGRGVLNQHVFKVSSLSFPQWFYYLWLQHYLPDFQSIADDKATTMGHIKRHHLSETFVLLPTNELLLRMTSYIQTLLDQQIVNELNSTGISKLRDSLLPKLISGELRVPCMDRFF